MRKRKGWPIAIGLVVLAVVAVFVAGAVVPGGASQARADDPVVLTVNHNGTFVKSYTQSDLAALGAYSGYAGIINSGGVVTGPDPVQGVTLKAVLADALGATALTAQQSLDIYSPSPAPYIQTLTYDQVEDASPSTFVMYDATTKQPVTTLAGTLSSVLVWASGNPLTLPADQGPLRFYVADAQNDNAVMVRQQSVFNVTQLNVRDQVLPPWNLKLVGLKINGTRPTDTIDQNTYQSCCCAGLPRRRLEVGGRPALTRRAALPADGRGRRRQGHDLQRRAGACRLSHPPVQRGRQVRDPQLQGHRASKLRLGRQRA